MNAHIVAAENDHSLDAVRAGVKQLEIPTLLERTRHHAHYNEVLRGHVGRAGFAFLDDFSPFLGPDGGVDPRFIPTTCGHNHHMEAAPTAPVIKGLITRTA